MPIATHHPASTTRWNIYANLHVSRWATQPEHAHCLIPADVNKEHVSWSEKMSLMRRRGNKNDAVHSHAGHFCQGMTVAKTSSSCKMTPKNHTTSSTLICASAAFDRPDRGGERIKRSRCQWLEGHPLRVVLQRGQHGRPKLRP